MKPCSYLIAVGASLIGGTLAYAQADKVILRLEPGGPTSALTAVAFSPDGQRLYATGFDKVVRVWVQEQGTFKLSKIAYRVPVAPGYAGTINALAVSPDGAWLAAGGLGVMRGGADFRTVGRVFPALGTKAREQLEDEGTIFVFNVNNEREIKVLRGHAGVIRALSFLPPRDGKPPLLVSAAAEPTGNEGESNACVRLWDVAKATSLAEQVLDVDTKSTRPLPGLTAWHTGPNPRDVGVAVTWQDGQVRIWNIARNSVAKVADGKYNVIAAHGTETGRFLTANSAEPGGVVRLWQSEERDGLTAQPAGEQIRLARVRLPGDPYYYPRDLATFPTQPNGPIDRAVVLARRRLGEPSDDKDVLFLIDLGSRQVLGPVPLGPFQVNVRRVAASPTGAHIAVADADNQQVWVFSTADLVARHEKPRQVLRGVGTSFKVVSFRKKGIDQGLYLEEDGGAAMLFDFTGRQLRANDPAWVEDSPDKTGWHVVSKPERHPLAITVSGPGFPAQTIALEKVARAVETALLPPRKGEPFGPVLAVGWLDKGSQARLALYDVRTATKVRQLAGHVGPVHSLAFSSDGRLLASAAADQTVCLWSMTSLGQVLGKAGALQGISVIKKEETVVVARAPAGSPLKEETVVEGIVEEGKLRRFTTPLEFHIALFEMKPGSTVVLRTRPPGAAAAADVKLTVDQGTDERKPLLSLFVTRGPDREWIAWTSMGPYDASSRGAEDYLGWHFNPDKPADPGKPAEPVAFVRADKYRKDYEKKGILEHVVRRANVPEALKDYENVRPQLEGAIDGMDLGGPRIGALPLVQTQALTVQLELLPPYSLERVSALTWQMDNGPWQDLGKPHDRQWSVDLSQSTWGRGPHTVRARLETDHRTRQLDWTTAFYYAPGPPRIEPSNARLRKYFPEAARAGLVPTTKEASFLLEARVLPGTPGEKVRVTLRHNGAPLPPIEGLDVRQKITLRDGENKLVLRAVNAAATKDTESRESDELVLLVNYYRERPAPQIVFRAVVPVVEGAEPLSVPPGKSVEVSAPKVRVVGRIIGEEELQEAKRDGRPLPAFAAGKQKQFDFEEELSLKPGENSFLYEARSAHSPVGSTTLRIVYQPTVAAIRGVRPLDGSAVYQREVEFQAELVPPNHKEPYWAELFVDGQRQVQQRLDAAAPTFKAKAQLKPGSNVVVVRLHNEWGASAVREVQVRYLRPPAIVKIDAPREAAQAVLDSSFRVEVESPADLRPTAARLNGKEFIGDQLQAELDRAAGRWKVTLRNVVLQTGDNKLTLVVANKDGDSRESATVWVRYTKPKPLPPVVKFPDYPNAEQAYPVKGPDHQLAFVVESKTPLRRVELRWEGDQDQFYRATADDLKRERLAKPHRVHLQPGQPRTFHLVAVNEGGEARAQVTLHWPQPPLYVEVEKLESGKTPGKYFSPVGTDGQGKAVFDKVPEGQVKLHGTISWNDANDEQFRKDIPVRVYANGFQQIPATAQPPAPGKRKTTFTAMVLLTQEKNNEIKVELPNLKMADGQRNACVVRECTDRISGRRLHVVMVGIDDTNAAALKEKALRAIGAVPVPEENERWKAPPAFERVEPYGPLVGQEVTPTRVRSELRRVKRKIQTTPRQNILLGEVVLLYYQGRELITEKGKHYLLTAVSSGDDDPERAAISCERIVELFSDVPGAQVVMLDAKREAKTNARQMAPAFDDPRLGVFHFFWLGGNVPPTRLLGLVEQCWGRVNNLRSLAQEVKGLAQPVAQFYGDVRGDLALLEFGGGKR
jgi:WD40 repeat protein